MKKCKGILFLVTLVSILLIAFFFINKRGSIKNNVFLDSIQSSRACGKEGDHLCNGSLVDSDCIKKCCSGLKEIFQLKYGGTCVHAPAPGAFIVCSKCGDGVCDSKNKEDECNCPEDCK